MNVRHRMTTNPFTVSPSDNLATAQARMQIGRFRSLPVVENHELVGILTDRDVRPHLGHLAETRVTAAMTEKVVTVAPTATLDEAAKVMLGLKIDSLPVVERGKLVGIITISDVLQAFLDVMGSLMTEAP